jgi:hypothetical protein
VPIVSDTVPGRGARTGLLAAAIGVPVLGLGIATVGILPLLGATPTSVSESGVPGPVGVTAFASLDVSVQNWVDFEEDEVWVVPVSADWASFPTARASSFTNCTDAQRAWLNAQGYFQTDYSVFTFANTASEGAHLSIYDVRLEGESEPIGASLEVHCRSLGGGTGGAELVYSSLGTASDAAAVVEGVDEIPGADVHYVVGEQVAFNLRPGDHAQLALDWLYPDPGLGFRGAVVASITSGEQEARVAITGNSETVSLATATMSASRIDVNQGVLFCIDGGDVEFASVVSQLATGCDSTSAMVGRWMGDVEGDLRPYSVQVAITEQGGRLSALAEYPEIPCTTTWSETARTDTSVQFLESVSPGSRCYDQVAVAIELVDEGFGGIMLRYSALSGGYRLSSSLYPAL